MLHAYAWHRGRRLRPGHRLRQGRCSASAERAARSFFTGMYLGAYHKYHCLSKCYARSLVPSTGRCCWKIQSPIHLASAESATHWTSTLLGFRLAPPEGPDGPKQARVTHQLDFSNSIRRISELHWTTEVESATTVSLSVRVLSGAGRPRKRHAKRMRPMCSCCSYRPVLVCPVNQIASYGSEHTVDHRNQPVGQNIGINRHTPEPRR